ncbi:hypothetical protein [Desulfotomaculum copahuensis]|nr:hypothetical protein [Desulfotomaculum copahuensis]
MEQTALSVPWLEKRKEYANIAGDEEIIARAWDLGEDLIFFFVMWLATF